MHAQVNINSSKLPNLLLPVFLAIVVMLLSLWVVGNSLSSEGVVFTSLSTLSYLSLGLFVVVCFLGLSSVSLYFTFLIFVLLAFPAPVNDFFPGVYLGSPDEPGNAIFPFITHIDIYLFLGLFKAVVFNNKIRFKGSFLFIVVILCLFISITVNFFDYSSTQEQLLLIQGLFQFRYLIELYLLLSFYDVRSYKNNLLLGFMLSVVFLFFESTIYSLSIGSKVLLSGSLANNVFASVIASILLFLLIIKKRYPHSFLYRTNIKLAALVAVIIIIATGARMAILAFFATYFIVSYLETGRKQSFVKQVSWFLSLVVLIYVLGILANQLPKRYNPDKIVSKITIHEFSSDLTKFIEIKPSWETSSLITRLKLYNTSLKMFSENPVCGIGPGRWNIQKMNYGFDKAVLIDSHNGYFSILSQYGLLGLPLMFFIYIFPTTLFYRNSKKKGLSIDFLFYLALINLYISISDLSNSGIFKHQIFSILAFNAIFLLQISKSASTQEITTLERSTSQLTKE